ncbi:hypothetical protein KIH86_27630 [Paenibacillus sp. HN-1]|uniref:WD40/YVTN/BNR-like repeat-containing protein n=1 Tax=Paenibacillus TaxID=44249 RepID=UPI001CA99873|nr:MULTISPECIES: YCF48-related protein [Paenibacillus]MBY9082425.1 hypothetical protein [Paenibacillus sp. CGMCC 1.18879]MBY9087965.1 hypothetical protein [Paenibacillus sinensis]
MNKMNVRKMNMLLAAALAILLALPGWSFGASAVKAAQAPASETGDHGLLKSLQEKELKAGSGPLAFNDIEFLSATTGRAAGNGFLIGTSDAGHTFQTIYEGQWSFSDIDFPDNVYGWALASLEQGETGRYLIATPDGGSHWKRLSDHPVTFGRVDFSDRLHGFAYDWAFVYYTSDGGKTWSKLTTPANTRGAYFASRSTGWAVTVAAGDGYRIMKTTNGGKTWKTTLKSSFDDPGYAEVYASGNQVWAVLYGGFGMSQTSYSLYASGDGGASWRRVIAQSTAGGGPAPGSGKSGLPKGPVSGKPGNMQLAGGGAFLLGYSPAGEEIGVGRSYDAGKTWSNLPGIPGYDGKISFTGAKSGWLADRGPDGSSLYMTQDGGATWKLKFRFAAK